MAEHRLLPAADRHPAFRQIFSNAAARLADTTTYATEELYTLALQVDTNAIYVLTALTPTWTVIA